MLRKTIVLLFLASVTGVSWADTLVLKDGRRLNGTVEEGDGVYIVKHDGKQLSVPDTEVAEWIAGRDEGPGAPAAEPLPEIKFDNQPEASADAPATQDGAAPESPVAPPRLGDNVNASFEKRSGSAEVDRRIPLRTERAVAFAVALDLLVTSARVAVDGRDMELMDRAGDLVTFELVRADEKVGLALLRVSGTAPLRPLMLADGFDSARINSGAPMRVAGFTGPDLFQPALEYADCTAERPVAAKPWTVNAAKHPGTPGGPVLFGNLVVGVQLASERTQVDRVPVVPLDQLRKFLGKDYAKPRTETDPAIGSMQLSAKHARSE